MYIQRSYRNADGKPRTDIKYIGPVDGHTPEKIHGVLKRVPTISSKAPQKIKPLTLNSKIKFAHHSISKIKHQKLFNAYTAFFENKLGMNISDSGLPKIKVRYGNCCQYKKQRHGYSVYLPKYEKGNRNKFHDEFKKAIGNAALDVLKKYKPLVYRQIEIHFDQSYERTTHLLSSLLLNTKDRKKWLKIFTLRYFGIYNPFYRSTLKHDDVGLVSEKRQNWRDEFAPLFSQIISSGYYTTKKHWQKKLMEAQKAEFLSGKFYKDKKRELNAFAKQAEKIGLWLKNDRRSLKRAILRRQSCEEVLRKLEIIRVVFGVIASKAKT